MTFAKVRALIFVGALFVAAGVMVIMAITRDTQGLTVRPSSCPSGLIPAKVKLPDRNDITINVYNGTSQYGLAEKIAQEFQFRTFKVHKVATAPKSQQYSKIAKIIYGPDAVGAAWVVSANFLVNEADMQFDIHRKGAEVDVILGGQFEQLASPTEVNQAIAANGNPDLPPGTCAAA